MRIFKDNQRAIFIAVKYICVFVLILVLGILYSCQRRDKDNGVSLELEASEVNDNSNNSEAIGSSDQSNNSSNSSNLNEENNKFICVHITGYVVNPGVYDVAEGARIYEVVRLAGGFLPEADESYLNLAAIVCDGQKIQVLSKEEAATAKQFISQTESETGAKLININTASKEELMQLPGIGESRALSIISYREKNGGFKEIADIMNISGIKEAAFEKIKDYICVE